MVVLYASIYGDVPMVVNLSGRFYLEKGIQERLGKEFMDRINKEGYIDVLNKSGKETCLTFLYARLLAKQIIYVICSLFLFHVHLLSICWLQCRKHFIQSNQREFDGKIEH